VRKLHQLRKVYVLLLLSTAFLQGVFAEYKKPYVPTPSGPQDIKNVGKNAPTEMPKDWEKWFYAPEKDVKWFEDAKFGIFVHWDPCCLKEAEISWHRFGPRPGNENKAKSGIPWEVYDNLYKEFNPTNFNADAWIKMVKEAGAKYFIFTTKHHGGFCMFDAPGTDFKITNTPFKRDICKELADACHKYDIKLFWYYSQPDWHHPDYLTPNHDKYRDYMYAQLRKLLTDYGKVDGIWFDCLNTSWKHWDSPRMIKMIRDLQPGILINSRWGWGMSVPHNGDFNNPEQEIGKFDISRPWETCFTMGRGWSWRGGGGLIPANDCIRMLIQCNGSGGNLALDCGPRPDGMIDPPEKENYLAMGNWLKKFGSSLYGTRAGPYKPGPFGVSTRKDDMIYLHLLAHFSGGKNSILNLPPLPVKVLSVTALNSAMEKPKKLKFKQKKEYFNLDLSGLSEDGIDTVVALKLASSAMKIEPIESGGKDQLIPVTAVSASSFYNKDYAPEGLLSGGEGKFEAGIHRKSEWVAKGNKKPQWFEIHFEKPEKVYAISLAEPRGRLLTRDFTIEYDDRGVWKELFVGERIGQDFTLIFDPVKTSKFRLNIRKYEPNDPGLSAFKAYRVK